MKAIKHYQDCFNGKLPAEIDAAYTSALIILQGKSWVHYSVLLNTEVVWTNKLPMGTAATDCIYVYVDLFHEHAGPPAPGIDPVS